MSLDICVAHSQGGIAYLLMQALENALREVGDPRHVVCLLTQVEVDRHDPAFDAPTKPIGYFYSEDEARVLSRETGWAMREDSGRGWRHVVPSPRPRHIADISLVRELSRAGAVVIAGGGGGIPVLRADNGVRTGIEAVIDKDLTSALMASVLGIDTMMILTGVGQVAIDFGKPGERKLETIGLSDARRYLAEGPVPAGQHGSQDRSRDRFHRARRQARDHRTSRPGAGGADRGGGHPRSARWLRRAATVRVAVAGRHAARCLARLARRPGAVFAAFERSVYLCEEAAEPLVCLGPMSIGAGPVNALAPDWPTLRFQAGDRVSPTGTGCRLADGLIVETGAALLYAPPAGPISVPRAAFDRLADKAARYARTDGLAPLVARGRAVSSPLLDRAAPGIDALAAWLESGAAAAPPNAGIERLLGLGPGLTPSGDDFLGGMMIALRAAGRGRGRRSPGRRGHGARAPGHRPDQPFAPRRRGRRRGARRPLHETLAALDRGDDTALDAGLAAIDQIGHSSGWDALAGAVSALGAQSDSKAAASSAASALEAATNTPASRRTRT